MKMPNLRNGSKGGFETVLTRLRVQHSTALHTKLVLQFIILSLLIKGWFGVSKFCSTTALRKAIQCKRASEVVLGHLRYGYHIGLFAGEESTQSLPFSKHYVRRDMGMWLRNRLQNLWCEGCHCYSVSEGCVCVNYLAVLDLRNIIY